MQQVEAIFSKGIAKVGISVAKKTKSGHEGELCATTFGALRSPARSLVGAIDPLLLSLTGECC